jgi:hypothetical protein
MKKNKKKVLLAVLTKIVSKSLKKTFTQLASSKKGGKSD